MDLENKSVEELKALQKSVEVALHKAQERERDEARLAVEKFAADLGFTTAELFDAKSKRPKNKVAPKYRDPNNPDRTWTGRGRTPKWVQEFLDAGKSLEDLKI